MPEWMRSQFMAPAYALLISLAVALVLGRAMRPVEAEVPPTEEKPAAAPVTVRLLAAKMIEPGLTQTEPATELKGSSVTIQSGKPLTLGEDGTVTAPAADGSLTVCVQLPGRWVGINAIAGGKPQSPCWNVEPKGSTVDLVVKEG